MVMSFGDTPSFVVTLESAVAECKRLSYGIFRDVHRDRGFQCCVYRELVTRSVSHFDLLILKKMLHLTCNSVKRVLVKFCEFPFALSFALYPFSSLHMSSTPTNDFKMLHHVPRGLKTNQTRLKCLLDLLTP